MSNLQTKFDKLAECVPEWQSHRKDGKEVQVIQINPEVLDRAKELTGSRSDDQLGQAFLNLTGATIRNYRSGKSAPSIITLMRLKEITGTPLDNMLISSETEAA